MACCAPHSQASKNRAPECFPRVQVWFQGTSVPLEMGEMGHNYKKWPNPSQVTFYIWGCLAGCLQGDSLKILIFFNKSPLLEDSERLRGKSAFPLVWGFVGFLPSKSLFNHVCTSLLSEKLLGTPEPFSTDVVCAWFFIKENEMEAIIWRELSS